MCIYIYIYGYQLSMVIYMIESKYMEKNMAIQSTDSLQQSFKNGWMFRISALRSTRQAFTSAPDRRGYQMPQTNKKKRQKKRSVQFRIDRSEKKKIIQKKTYFKKTHAQNFRFFLGVTSRSSNQLSVGLRVNPTAGALTASKEVK